MKRWLTLMGTSGLLLACGAATYWSGVEQRATAAPALELWGDMLRDVDQAGLHATRMTPRQEAELGTKLAATIRTDDITPDAQRVAKIGAKVASFADRKGFAYEFHVYPSETVNAFAVPGGRIYVMQGMLHFAKSDDELAAVIGHEIAHVDLRHCAERYQYQHAFGTMGRLAELARLPVTIGYAKYQELDADAEGVRLSAMAGYDPRAAAVLFDRLEKTQHRATPERADSIAEEAGSVALDAVGSYFSSHPPSDERSRRLMALARKYRRVPKG